MKETFFISHGTPDVLTDETLPARHSLKSFTKTVFHEKPKCILVISAHWETAEPIVSAVDCAYTIMYDFGNFPGEKPRVQYPASGSPAVVRRVAELLAGAGFKSVGQDKERGLDLSVWMPLSLMYPEADIPVVQLSVQSEKDAMHHYMLGKALAPLKDEGVLILGSGAAVHNIEPEWLAKRVENVVAPWAMEFDTWLKDALLDGRYEDVIRYIEKAPNAKIAHPRPEHLYPLHVAIGAAGDNSKAELIHTCWDKGMFSYSSYKFTSKP